MKALKISAVTLISVFLLACVTINIYFPAAQAEKAAERIVDDILGKQTLQNDKGSGLDRSLFENYAAAALDFLIPAAQAAQPDFNVNTPEIRKLQAAMKERTRQMKKYYASGAIGFTRDARVGIHNQSAIPLKERAKSKGLMAQENRDRDALYRAIAQANGHPEWETKVRATFAKTWIQRAEPGWWYQDASGRWKQR